MASDIGIKIANGDFYPILGENSTVKKRLVLTTVHDNQRSVQIDLYKSSTRTMVDALYIGSLIVESIKPRPRGEPSIELVISSTHGGEITADAVDMDTSVRGDHQTLKVSLKSVEGGTLDADLPDFELEQNELPPTGLFDKASKTKKLEENKGSVWKRVLVILVLLVLIFGALWFFILRDTDAGVNGAQLPPTPPPATVAPLPPAPPPAVVAPPPVAVAPPPVIQAPAQPPVAATPGARLRPPPPVSLFNVPAVIPSGGFPYRVRYGDTLWDISEAFYRNPLLYPHIARFNNIPNPNLIISGSVIYVPPRD